jgi:hypothetical protein
LAAAKKIRDFFIALLNSPCCETPKKPIKKTSKTTEAEKKRRKKTFFVMSPDGFLWEKNYRVLELPFLRNTKRPKTRYNKSIKNKFNSKFNSNSK